MRFSAKTEYGLRVLIELAELANGGSVPARKIAASQHIPQRFLEQQVTVLRKAGLVTSRRGAGGGCSLARPAGDISVAEAIEALEGPIIDVPASDDTSTAGRVVRDLWSDTGADLKRRLSAVTIAELAARKKSLDDARSPMFYI